MQFYKLCYAVLQTLQDEQQRRYLIGNSLE